MYLLSVVMQDRRVDKDKREIVAEGKLVNSINNAFHRKKFPKRLKYKYLIKV